MYVKNPDNFDIDMARNIFLLQEYLLYKNVPISLDQLHTNIVSPFEKKLFAEYYKN
jgi:hypothetical protein